MSRADSWIRTKSEYIFFRKYAFVDVIYAHSLLQFINNNKNNRMVNTKFFSFDFRKHYTIELNENLLISFDFFFAVYSKPTTDDRRVKWNAAKDGKKTIFFRIIWACADSIWCKRACERGAYKLAHSILYFRVTIDCNKARRKCGKQFFFVFCSSSSTLESLSLP